jgi:hypothetical protein
MTSVTRATQRSDADRRSRVNLSGALFGEVDPVAVDEWRQRRDMLAPTGAYVNRHCCIPQAKHGRVFGLLRGVSLARSVDIHSQTIASNTHHVPRVAETTPEHHHAVAADVEVTTGSDVSGRIELAADL